MIRLPDLTTPLGVVSMTVSGLKDAKPQFSDGTSGLWTRPGFKARLSAFPYTSHLDASVWVRPTVNWGFLWQLETTSPQPPITLGLALDAPGATPNSGQGFHGLSLDNGEWEVVLGGPDEEQLAWDVARGLVPPEWQSRLEELALDPSGTPVAQYLPQMRGLRWLLPAMSAGQSFSMAANCCWSPTRTASQSDDESTWYAAQESTAAHLRRLGS